MLIFISFFLLMYALIRFVVPLHCCDTFIKLLISALLCFVSQKFKIYEWTGNTVFAPDIPRWFLLSMEAAYSTLLILVFFLILRDIILLLLLLLRACGKNCTIPFSPDRQRICLFIFSLLLGVVGVWQAVKLPSVHQVDISLSRLPQEFDGFSIIHLSDLHIGSVQNKEWLSIVVQKSNEQHPDLVVITGDFLDGTPRTVEKHLKPLSDLRAKYGVYGVTGNHEYYYGAHIWSPILEKLGVDLLYNETKTFAINGKQITLVGIPDGTAKHYGDIFPNLEWALHNTSLESVRILLSHRPNIDLEKQKVDLQLSGHTHGGLMLFLKPIIAAFNSGFVCGLYELPDRKVYVSSGTGLWNGLSCRLGVSSEIVHIILHSGKKESTTSP